MINRAFDSSSASSDITFSSQSSKEKSSYLISLPSLPLSLKLWLAVPVLLFLSFVIMYTLAFREVCFSVHFIIHFRQVHS